MGTRSITAANQFTDFEAVSSTFDVSIHSSASFVGTITLQRKHPGEADALARDVRTWTVPAEETGRDSGAWLYRIGCKTGAYTSGSIIVEVS
jgi:hypothetical protein